MEEETKYVVIGYAASHTQYIVEARKAYSLELDKDNGEQVLTHPLSLEEAYEYINPS